jgi:hypothetical protein
VGFLGLPYLPFFSNCKGTDSYISFSKMLETDPRCQLVDYENTVPVSPLPWEGSTTPNADKCEIATPAELNTKVVNGETIDWLGPVNGALFECVFEENIAVTLTKVRWYEAGAGATLFYFGIEPFEPSQFEPSFTTNKDLSKEYSTFWGRGESIDNIR